MSNRKKIILFIAEGINDKTNLALCLSRLLSNDEVHFEITNGDITTRKDSNPANIAAQIGSIVKKHSGKIFKKSDYLEIVHLVDMDGAYIPDDRIIENETEKPIYREEYIECKNPGLIAKRNRQKRDIIDRMLTISKVWTSIPYSVYYFSCNMDHVLHNQANPAKDEKNRLACRFENKYYNEPQKFVKYFDSKDISVEGDYAKTWEFIREGTNSLKRKSNFNIYLHRHISDRMEV